MMVSDDILGNANEDGQGGMDKDIIDQSEVGVADSSHSETNSSGPM
jgi:hypothetical protein